MVSEFVGYDGNTTFYALSTDTISEAENGNIKVDVDTGDVSIYDAENTDWVLMFNIQSAEEPTEESGAST